MYASAVRIIFEHVKNLLCTLNCTLNNHEGHFIVLKILD